MLLLLLLPLMAPLAMRPIPAVAEGVPLGKGVDEEEVVEEEEVEGRVDFLEHTGMNKCKYD